MQLNETEIKEIIKEIRLAVIEEVKRITKERVINDNRERIDKYAHQFSERVVDVIKEEFPL